MKRIAAQLEICLIRQWQRRGLLAWALCPFSYVFAGCAALRRASFALGWRTRFNVGPPVVVVGNVTVGGTGKTPTVIALVHALRATGFTPGVVARGYRGQATAWPAAVTVTSLPSLIGDEPLLIARLTHAPVWVGANRVAAARALCAAHPEVDVIISDDGLQHYRLARAVELVVFDQRLGGNGFMLPAGPLREPLSRRRDATLINDLLLSEPHVRAQLFALPNTFALTLTLEDAWQLDNPSVRRPLIQFKHQRVLAAAGIGSPERFFASLRAAGLTPLTHAWPDHYAFEHDPFAHVEADTILVTEKDAVKLRVWRDARVWVVPVKAVLPPRLITLVVEKLRGRSPA